MMRGHDLRPFKPSIEIVITDFIYAMYESLKFFYRSIADCRLSIKVISNPPFLSH